MASLEQVSMVRGEVSPQAAERVDLQWWPTALKTCRNFQTTQYGGVKNRAGTPYVTTVKDSLKLGRLIPFRVSATESYVLEFGPLYIRVIKNGEQLVYTSGPDIGDPVEIVTPFTEAELAELRFTQSVDVMTICHPNHLPQNLSRYSDETWTLGPVVNTSGPWLELNVDSTTTVGVSDLSGEAVTVVASKAIFSTANEGQLFYIEQRNYGQPWEPGKVVAEDYIRRSDAKYYRARTAGTTGTLRPTHFTDVWNDGGVDWEYLHSGFGVISIDDVAVNGLSFTGAVIARMPGSLTEVTLGSELTVAGIASSPLNTIKLTFAAPHDIASEEGFCSVYLDMILNGIERRIIAGTFKFFKPSPTEITLIDSTEVYYPGGTVTFVSGTFQQQSGGASGDPVGSYRWKFGAWGGDQGYPSVVTYHQGRRIYANSPGQPHTVWSSRVDAFDDFSMTSPIADDDPLTFTLRSGQLNDIKGMISSDKLLVLTGGAEWVVGSDEVLTPANIRSKMQGYRGSADLQPIGVGDVAIYVQSKGQIIRDLSYVFADDKYTGAELTALSNHLFEGRSIVSMDYQQHPYSTVWCAMSDGTVVGMTYMREQQVVGFHRHEFFGDVESLCVVSEGQDDVVYMLTNSPIDRGTRRYIVRQGSRVLPDLTSTSFLDCSTMWDGALDPTITLTITSASGEWGAGSPLQITTSEFIYFAAADGDRGFVVEDGGLSYRFLHGVPEAGSVGPTLPLDVVATVDIPFHLRGIPVGPVALLRDRIESIPAWSSLGDELTVIADGADLGELTVTGLKPLNPYHITVPYPYASKVIIGKRYTSELETLSVNASGQESLNNKAKVINAVSIKALESRSVWAGRTLDDLYEYDAETDTSANGLLREGLIDISITTPWSTDGSVVIQHTKAAPITITSLIPEVQLGL